MFSKHSTPNNELLTLIGYIFLPGRLLRLNLLGDHRMRITFKAPIDSLEGSGSIGLSQRLARWISDIFSPPVFSMVGVSLITSALGTFNDRLWMLFYLVVAIGVPVLYLFWLVRKGKITDFHIKERHQRIHPMLFMIACSTIAWAVMQMGSAVLVLRMLALAGSFLMMFLLLVTLWWKISGHSTAVAAFSVFCIGYFGPIALPVFLLIPMVVWSRVHLKRHSFGQTIAGLVTGGVFMVFVLYGIAI
jgi:hypothetical protein